MINGMIRLLNIEAYVGNIYIHIYVWCVCDITNNLHILLRNTNKAHECFAYDIIFRYYLKR